MTSAPAIVVGVPEIRILDVPAEVIGCVNGTAEEAGIAVADVFARAIAHRFEIDLGEDYAPGRYSGGVDGPDLTLDVPEIVRFTLRTQAAQGGKTMRGIAINTLSEVCGLAPYDEFRRPRS